MNVQECKSAQVLGQVRKCASTQVLAQVCKYESEQVLAQVHSANRETNQYVYWAI